MGKKLTAEELSLVNKLDDIISVFQSEIDAMLLEREEMKKPIKEIEEKIRSKRMDLAPIAELKASFVSADSRDKYHPEDTKSSIKGKVMELVNG
jgi:hypothetical protein